MSGAAAAVALSLERLAGRPAVLWTTLSALAIEAQAAKFERGGSTGREPELIAWSECKRTGVTVQAVRLVEASSWQIEAQEQARREFVRHRADEAEKVFP